MNIRALRAEDYVAWLRLWQGYQQFYQTEIDEATTGACSPVRNRCIV